MKLVKEASVRPATADEVAVSAGPTPPWRVAPWHAAQLVEYKAAASIGGVAVVADAVLEAAELPAALVA
jgi:hypothetical protein